MLFKKPFFGNRHWDELQIFDIINYSLMVEAAGVEPASGNLPLHFLRTYLLFWVSLSKAPGSRIPRSLSCIRFSPLSPQAWEIGYPASMTPPNRPDRRSRGDVSRL